jgi:Fe2+ transport system protein FeoA
MNHSSNINHTERPLTLDQLKAGRTATIRSLSCQGAIRYRLMDLGILPGTQIEVEMRSPLGDPTAYRVRGAVIAIRNKQAKQIEITILDRKE